MKKKEAAQKEVGLKTLEEIKRKAITDKIEKRKQEIFEEQRKLKEEEDRKRTDSENIPDDAPGSLVHETRRIVGSEHGRNAKQTRCHDTQWFDVC